MASLSKVRDILSVCAPSNGDAQTLIKVCNFLSSVSTSTANEDYTLFCFLLHLALAPHHEVREKVKRLIFRLFQSPSFPWEEEVCLLGETITILADHFAHNPSAAASWDLPIGYNRGVNFEYSITFPSVKEWLSVFELFCEVMVELVESKNINLQTSLFLSSFLTQMTPIVIILEEFQNGIKPLKKLIAASLVVSTTSDEISQALLKTVVLKLKIDLNRVIDGNTVNHLIYKECRELLEIFICSQGFDRKIKTMADTLLIIIKDDVEKIVATLSALPSLLVYAKLTRSFVVEMMDSTAVISCLLSCYCPSCKTISLTSVVALCKSASSTIIIADIIEMWICGERVMLSRLRQHLNTFFSNHSNSLQEENESQNNGSNEYEPMQPTSLVNDEDGQSTGEDDFTALATRSIQRIVRNQGEAGSDEVLLVEDFITLRVIGAISAITNVNLGVQLVVGLSNLAVQYAARTKKILHSSLHAALMTNLANSLLKVIESETLLSTLIQTVGSLSAVVKFSSIANDEAVMMGIIEKVMQDASFEIDNKSGEMDTSSTLHSVSEGDRVYIVRDIIDALVHLNHFRRFSKDGSDLLSSLPSYLNSPALEIIEIAWALRDFCKDEGLLLKKEEEIARLCGQTNKLVGSFSSSQTMRILLLRWETVCVIFELCAKNSGHQPSRELVEGLMDMAFSFICEVDDQLRGRMLHDGDNGVSSISMTAIAPNELLTSLLGIVLRIMERSVQLGLLCSRKINFQKFLHYVLDHWHVWLKYDGADEGGYSVSTILSSILSSFLEIWIDDVLSKTEKIVSNYQATALLLDSHVQIRQLWNILSDCISEKQSLPVVKACLHSFSLLAQRSIRNKPLIGIWATSKLTDFLLLINGGTEYKSDRGEACIFVKDELHFVFECGFERLLAQHGEVIMEVIIFPFLKHYCDVYEDDKQSEREWSKTLMSTVFDQLLKVSLPSGSPVSLRKWLGLPSSSSLFYATIVLNFDLSSPKLVMAMGSILPFLEAKVGLILPKTYLLDELPLVVYYILMLLRCDTTDSNQGTFDFIDGLQRLSSLLKVRLSLEAESGHQWFAKPTFNHIFLSLVWGLGSEYHTVVDRSLRALRILCWQQQHAFANSIENVSKRIDSEKDLQLQLSVSFLYVMSNLLQQEWQQQSYSQQCQCLRALTALVELLHPPDLAKFLPKLLTAVDSALMTSSNNGVTLLAVQLVACLTDLLPADVLEENICSLLVGLYPVITGKAKDANHSQSLPPATNKTAANKVSINAAGYESSLPRFAFCLGKEQSNAEVTDGRSIAVRLLNSLVSSRKPLIKRLPSIPDVDDFVTIKEAHSQFVSELSIQEQLQRIMALLKHSNSQVVSAALQACRDLIIAHKATLYGAIESRLTDSMKMSDSSSLPLVNQLFNELLSLCTRQHDKGVLLECSVCLGELGGIDPHFIVFSSDQAQISLTDRASLHSAIPTQVQGIDFALRILIDHIIPSLKSAQDSTSQDKAAYGIQRLLQTSADMLLQNETEQPRIDTVTTNGMPPSLKELLVQRGVYDIVEPFWHSKYFVKEISTNELSKPRNDLLSTSLTFTATATDRVAGATPSARPKCSSMNVSFSRWIGEWCRCLITINDGPLKEVFWACRSLVRSNSDLCQHLLPYLLMDTLCGANPTHAQECIEELKRSLKQWHRIQSHGVGQEGQSVYLPVDHRAIQYVFTIFDIFTSWSHNLQQSSLKSSSTRSATASLPSTTITGKSSNSNSNKSSRSSGHLKMDRVTSASSLLSMGSTADDIMTQARSVMDALPLELLCDAAMSIKAYARAIRYVEIHARQRHLSQSFSERNEEFIQQHSAALPPRRRVHPFMDQMPLLRPYDIKTLAISYAMLEDVDSLQGVQAIRKAQNIPDLYDKCNILEFELRNDWMNALIEYDLVYQKKYQQRMLGLSSQTEVVDRDHSVPCKKKPRTSQSFLNNESFSVSQISQTVGNESSSISSEWKDIGDFEKGKLRCLLELGNLEAIIDHVAKQNSQLSDAIQSHLLPLGVEAAWRLGDWEVLDTFLSEASGISLKGEETEGNRLRLEHTLLPPSMVTPTSRSWPPEGDDMFRIALGRLFQSMRLRETDHFHSLLDETRLQTMNALSAASMESYERTYPHLVRLHCLCDLERSYSVLKENSLVGDSFFEENLYFTKRLRLMSDSSSYRDTILAIHRTIYGLMSNAELNTFTKGSQINGKHEQLIGSNWLQQSTFLHEVGRYGASYVALKKAAQFGVDDATIQLKQAVLLKEQGLIQEALTLLEPSELDIEELQKQIADYSNSLKGTSKGESGDNKKKRLGEMSIDQQAPHYLMKENQRQILAQRIHLATQCLQESQIRQGASIVERYLTVIALHNHWDRPYYDLGKYYEYLYHQYSVGSTSFSSNSMGINRTTGTSQQSSLSYNSQEGTNAAGEYQLIEKALQKFGQCLLVSSNMLLIAEVLPRMLTLWLTFTGMSALSGQKQTANKRAITSLNRESSPNALQEVQTSINNYMGGLAKRIPTHLWYMSIAQLVSRVLHSNLGTVGIIVVILDRILLEHPKHAIWHIANLMNSSNTERNAVAKRLLRGVYDQLNSSGRKEDGKMLVESQHLFRDLISLAKLHTKEKRIRWQMEHKITLQNYLIPTQEMLLSCPPIDTQPATDGCLQLLQFQDSVDVASSKAKPKTIVLLSKCGQKIKFLCKQEKDGDLRKDAHMMEVNALVNRLLTANEGGRRRKLGVTTFGVICLNEECGLLEWVNNTACLRQMVNISYTYDPEHYPNIVFKEIYQRFLDMQSAHQNNLPKLVDSYIELISSFRYRPCFHLWFLFKHSDPTAWLMARERYTRSVAVWSAIGYVVGLGDRHTENILLNTMTCEAVHVDFDCLFDKGLSLLVPEIVPFRLTANMIDAMGIAGVEGVFRQTLELCLAVLREHREALLSVLEPFLRDPTVNWSRSGRAQRSDSGLHPGGGQANGSDSENKEANDMLAKISDRLKGVYNIVHPHREKLLRGSSLPLLEGKSISRGYGAGREEQLLPLSVQGQAQRLIDEATAVENMAQLYVGWQPWM